MQTQHVLLDRWSIPLVFSSADALPRGLDDTVRLVLPYLEYVSFCQVVDRAHQSLPFELRAGLEVGTRQSILGRAASLLYQPGFLDIGEGISASIEAAPAAYVPYLIGLMRRYQISLSEAEIIVLAHAFDAVIVTATERLDQRLVRACRVERIALFEVRDSHHGTVHA